MADILNQAADLIRGGWLQHSWFAYLDDTGPDANRDCPQRQQDGWPSGGRRLLGRWDR
jgi:hypothetical protein